MMGYLYPGVYMFRVRETGFKLFPPSLVFDFPELIFSSLLPSHPTGGFFADCCVIERDGHFATV